MDRWVKPVAGYAKSRYVIVLSSVWIVWISEVLSRGNALQALEWTWRSFAHFGFNVLTVLGFLLLISALTGRPRAAYWSIGPVILIFSWVSGIKLKILHVPLLPWDFLLAGETRDMIPYITNLFTFPILAALIVFLAGSYGLQYRLPPSPVRIYGKERWVLASSSLLLLTFLYTDFPPLQKTLGFETIDYNQADNVKENGFALASLMNVKLLFQNSQDRMDTDTVEAIVSQYQPPTPAGESRPPNVIVVLSESLWDPTVLKDVKFSRDPLEFYHSLQHDYPSGTLLSPQFGGGTANVEFEVLTGLSMRFLPQGSIAYNQYINRPVDSLASILTRQGYTAKAISPFHHWYFNSDKVYEYFGFSQYISMEFLKPVYEGPYIADKEVANVIISETERTEGPAFIFANTMQNHFHYYPGKFKQNTIRVEGRMSEESRGMLETYAQGTKGADDMLKQLVEYFSASEEPTILAFFGDHLPFLGDNYKVYKDVGYLQEKDPDFLDKMYRVPVIVWNNYLPNKQETINLSPSFLGPYILELAKVGGSYYTDYLLDLGGRIPVIPPKDYYERMGIRDEDLKEYEALQYDILFGEQHGYSGWKDSIVQPGFTLGYDPMILGPFPSEPLVIGQSLPLTAKEASVPIKGRAFAPLSVVYINGKPQPTEWISEQQIVVHPQSDIYKPGQWELQVKILDDKETVIAESETWTVTVSAAEGGGYAGAGTK